MKNLLKPQWLFIANVIPTLLLFFLLKGNYNIIVSLLNEESLKIWHYLGIALITLGISNLGYALFLVYRKKQIPLYYGIVSLIFTILFLYEFVEYSYELIFSVPRWLVSNDIEIYPWTFLMPSLFYSLLTIIVNLTPADKKINVWKNFLYALIVPVFWFIVIQVIAPLRLDLPYNFNEHIIIIFAICNILIFFFFLIRGTYLLILRKSEYWRRYQLLWRIIIALALPILGLYINNTSFSNKFGFPYNKEGIFGNFNNYWFYILAVLNGILICIPELKNEWVRLILFLGRSLTFTYTFYFFLVFIPFLPFSIFAIVVVGAGFLMLVPLILFLLHIQILSNDFLFLKNHYSKNTLRISSFLCFLSIPLCITLVYLNDKKNLNLALDYVFTPDYSREYHINTKSLSQTLKTIRYHKEKNSISVLNSHNIPYLSSYFNWIVLDNLTLSDSKIETLDKIFFGDTQEEMDSRRSSSRNERNNRDSIKISHIDTKTRFDLNQKAWISEINLELTNPTKFENSEYQTTFELPDGCWISNYYLYVGNKKEMGILAEKKSALWVYSQIINYRQDPGILYYLTGNKIGFRVFPFSGNENRKTGIELIHKDPVKITLDGNTIELGNFQYSQETSTSSDKNIIYIPAEQKKQLPEVQRKSYYHFIVDASKDQDSLKNDYIQRIENFVKQNPEKRSLSKISFCNSYFSSIYPLTGDWKTLVKNQENKGGFYLDRAIKTILYNSYKNAENTYPVIVVVSNNIENSIIENDFSELKIAYPENSLFYRLNEDGTLDSYSLTSNSKIILESNLNPEFTAKVRVYPNAEKPIAYLPDDNSPSLILKKEIFSINEKDLKEKNWNSALEMQGVWITRTFHPEAFKKDWVNLVKYSFVSQIMNPSTSFMVVENEAQKAMLKKKQEQVLKSRESLDLDEDTQPMSEPGLLLVMTLFMLLFIGKLKRKKRSLFPISNT